MAAYASWGINLSIKPSPTSLSWKNHLSSTSAFAISPRSGHRQYPRFVILAMGVKSTVLVAKKLREARLNLREEFADVDCSYNLPLEELCTKISLCDALIVRSGTKVSREVFELSGGRLKVVGRAGVGTDNVDLAAAERFVWNVLLLPELFDQPSPIRLSC